MLEYMIEQIAQAEINAGPFDHIEFEAFFPPAEYKNLLEAMPDPEFYTTLGQNKRADGSPTRAVFDLLSFENRERAGIDTGGNPWIRAVTALASPQFARACIEKFKAPISQRYGMPAANVTHTGVEVRLMRDTIDYQLLPHVDSLSKIVTLQVYLPHDDSNRRLGTTFYIQNIPTGQHVEYKTLSFLPNRAYAFPIMPFGPNASWHGREKIVNNVVRDTLIINIRRR